MKTITDHLYGKPLVVLLVKREMGLATPIVDAVVCLRHDAIETLPVLQALFGRDPTAIEGFNDNGPAIQWPLLLTWFNFNPSMDK